MGTEAATPVAMVPTDGLELNAAIDAFQAEPIHPKPETPILVYLYSHAVGDPQSPRPHETPLPIDSLNESLTDYEDALDAMESHRWIEQSGEVIELTPSGSGIAKRLYHQVGAI